MNTTRAYLNLSALARVFPHGVARPTDLVALGLSGTCIEARCGPAGPWRRLAPGAVLLDHGPPPRTALIQAALLAVGGDAVVSGPDAVALHGLAIPPPAGPVLLLVPPGRRVRAGASLCVRRTARLPDPLLRGGFPVASLSTAVLDTCRRIPVRSVDPLLARVISHGVRPARLLRDLALGSRTGSGTVRRAINALERTARRTTRDWARTLLVRSGLPPPRWHTPPDAGDERLGVADAWWPEAGLAWQIDPYPGPADPRELTESTTVSYHRMAVGITTVMTRAHRIREDTVAVIDELRTAYRTALAIRHNHERSSPDRLTSAPRP